MLIRLSRSRNPLEVFGIESDRDEWVIVYITAAYSIVSLLTLFVIKRQTTLMAEQSKFAISKERARISVEIVTQPEEIDDPFWDIRFKVCNIGPTHAFEVKMTIGSTENDKSSCLFAAPVEKIAIAPTLKSGEERETRYWPPLQDYVAASEGKTVVYLLGSLEFEDVFGKQRVTIFTYRWRVGGLEKVKQPSRWEYVGERENLHA